jgi:hypothetical protein
MDILSEHYMNFITTHGYNLYKVLLTLPNIHAQSVQSTMLGFREG